MVEADWPDDWESRVAGATCVICDALPKGDTDHWIHVASGPSTEVYLDRGSRIPGYCLVVWRLGHVSEPTELDTEAAARYWQEVLAAGRALSLGFAPLKINYFTLGNTVPHLHTHVVPRFRDDPAPGGPLTWDQVVGDPVFTEDELRRQAAALVRAGLGS
jgi:diadenosine tetraphosphate (Ap4A) HIT family hydrolase